MEEEERKEEKRKRKRMRNNKKNLIASVLKRSGIKEMAYKGLLSNNCSIARHPCRAINNIHAKCLQTVEGQKTLDTPINSLTDTQQTLYKKVAAFLFFRYRIIKTFYRLRT